MPEIEDWLQENYRAKAADRGTTVDKLAPEFETSDPVLAAWMRSQAAPEPTAAPKARKAPAKSEG